MVTLKEKITVFAIAVLACFCFPADAQEVEEADNTVVFADSIAREIIDYSLQFMGKPYRRGSAGPNRFDCSGFTSFIFKSFGYKLSHGCTTQVREGTRVEIDELQTGDLIFFKGRSVKSSRVGHVGIVIENKGSGNITFIHAACHGGIRIDDLNTLYYNSRYVTGLRVLI
jgi:cell wall-associated NlpC family hydrolase